MATVIRAESKHRPILRNLFELYAHDFSPMTGADVDAHGAFTPRDFLSGWWDKGGDAFNPFLLRVDDQWAGFAFVELGSYVAPSAQQHWLMEEFFILRKYRRRGLGRWFARELLMRFPGAWEIGQIPENMAATTFWRRLLREDLRVPFEEQAVDNDRWQGPVQTFVVAAQAT
jgi:predicted acetyltransferase